MHVSISTIKNVRKRLGWICKRTRYCALISEVNQEKRYKWCKEHIDSGDLAFKDVIWTDECSVQLESHRKVVFHKKTKPAPLHGKPKHPLKVHLWGGISCRGATSICIFTGTLTATCYTQILDQALIPFLSTYYPDGHRYQQDNDPKHTSRWAQAYFENQGINWWRTPPSSPDLNPIENVWGSLKEYLRTYVKPRNLGQLKSGIKEFWKTLTPEKCARYIAHMKKVIPKVIEVQGKASGYCFI